MVAAFCLAREFRAAVFRSLRRSGFWAMPFDYSFLDECSDYGLDVIPSLGGQSGVDVEGRDDGDSGCVFRYELGSADLELVVLDVKAIRTTVGRSH